MTDTNPEELMLQELHQKVRRDREQRSEEHTREVLQRGLNQKNLTGPLNLYADGDSWFEYPLSKEIIGWLRADGHPTPAINNQAHHGDSAVERLGVAKRQRLIDNLNAPNHGIYDALLFSAGGNDIAGDSFVLWILRYVRGLDPAHGIDRQRLAGELAVIKGAYEDLITIRDGYDPNCTVFLHGYDWALPSGIRVCPGIGPWLKPSLDFQGWTDPTLARGVVKEVLLAFDKMLAQVAHDHGNVIYVHTQGTLQAASDWANELHPTGVGFQKITAKVLAAMRTKFPGRI